MYAVIETGGKQYRVCQDQTLKLETLPAEVGKKIDFDKVLVIGDEKKPKIGSPYVKGSKVTAEVLAHGRHKKVHVLKFKRRKNSMKQMGHRQNYTEVKITKISG